MTVTNFENITQELTEKELKLIPILIRCFASHTKDNPIKAPEIVNKMNKAGYKMSEPRLRKCCNYIRSNAMLPLIATSDGYYCSYDKEIIKSQMQSLYERANSIKNCADGLARFLSGEGYTP